MNKEEVAIANDYLGSDKRISEIEKRLEKIAEAGFTHVHWGNDWSGPYFYSYHEMCYFAKLLDKFHLKAKGVHATEGVQRFQPTSSSLNRKWGDIRFLDDRKNFLSDNEYSRKAGVEIIKNRMDLAEMIGAEEIVLHFAPPYRYLRETKEYREKFWENTKKSFDELEKYSKNKKIKIALENLHELPVEDLEEYFDALLDIYSPDFLGMCYDSGHAMIRNAAHICSFLEKYAERIIAVHLHDNMGYAEQDYEDELKLSKADMHLLPFEGVINWDMVMAYLAKTTYKLPLTLEVRMPSNVSEDEFLSKAYKSATELTARYKQARLGLA